jgi:heme/copper-type cytochrome/quinol oxidase subunit 2
VFAYPVDETGLYRWLFIGVVAYVLVAYLICLCRFRRIPQRHVQPIAANAAAASTSAALLWGVVDPSILALIGATTPYLIVAGITGLGYSLHALFEDRST